MPGSRTQSIALRSALTAWSQELKIFWCPELCCPNIQADQQLGFPFENESKDYYYAEESGA